MNIKDCVQSCFMTGFIAVLGIFPPITIFLCPTPITLQSLGVMLAGCLLGAKKGGLSLLIFLFLLSIGVPVLSLMGGISLLFTPFGGFVLSWPFAAFFIGWLTEKNWERLSFIKLLLINFVGGVIVIYLPGVPWMALFAKFTLLHSLYLSLTFLPGDALKIFFASWIGITFKKYYPLIKTSVKSNPKNLETVYD